jgi:hypothetical protein
MRLRERQYLCYERHLPVAATLLSRRVLVLSICLSRQRNSVHETVHNGHADCLMDAIAFVDWPGRVDDMASGAVTKLDRHLTSH